MEKVHKIKGFQEFVTWKHRHVSENPGYTRHEDDKTVTETIPALDFIKKLIVHISEKHFKMLRHYGIYAKHHKQEKKLRKCISAKKQRFLRSIQD